MITIDNIIRITGTAALPKLSGPLLQSLAIEKPERVELRQRLQAYRIPGDLIREALHHATPYPRLIQILDHYEPNTMRLKSLAGRIWTNRSAETHIQGGSVLYFPGGPEVQLPRGLRDQVLAYYRINSEGQQVKDRTTGGEFLPFGVRGTVTLRDYQEEALLATRENEQGIIVAPCGAGKTAIGIEIIRLHCRHAAILVHTRELADQWVARIKEHLPGLGVGVWGTGKQDLSQPVTVAILQSVDRWVSGVNADLDRRSEALKWIQRIGTVIVDECHHVPALTFQRVVDTFPARYRYGLTATPTREDGYTEILHWCLGSIIHEITHDRLYAAGAIVRPRIEEIPLIKVWESNFDPVGQWSRWLTDLATNEHRIAVVAKVLQGLAEYHVLGLVLASRVELTVDLAETLRNLGVPAVALHGALSKKARRAALQAARDGKVKILLATTIADEGLDLPILDWAALVTPSRAGGRTIQRLGRIMRPAPGKGQPVLYDFVDRDHPVAVAQWYSRRRAYKAAGAELPGRLPAQTYCGQIRP